ncbi:MAG: FAD-dependent oxidoreductase [Prochloraceae cyanobacterium]|nr:FAD-dependent oxidoreductase [Prochloraceae cyanobacterium]
MSQVAVIGCGVVGAAIAYELSLVVGLDVTLLDKQAPASGSTGAALGILMGAISHKTKGRSWRLRQTSMQRYETLIPELEAITGEIIPFNRQGILMLRFNEEDEAQWDKLAAIRQSQGYNLETWDRKQLQEKCPHIASDKILGAIYSPQDRQVNPQILTTALVAGAAKNGVNCRFGVVVENVSSTALAGSNIRRCCQIHTSAGTIEVDWLVIAAGLGSTPLTASLAEKIDIRPVLGQALHLKLDRPIGNLDFQPIITGDDIHIVPLGGGEYWVGATVEFPDSAGEVVAQKELLEQVKQQAIAYCPALADAIVINTWSGKRPRPEGQPAPIIRELPGYSNVLLATGHYRNGVLLAPATALIIRDMLTLPR